jgi:hypothetical protein
MKQGDSFLEKLQPLDDIPQLLARKNRFEFNSSINKTLGLLLVRKTRNISTRV